MSGETEQSKEAKRLSGEYGKIQNQANNDKTFDIFDDYKPEFGYAKQKAALDTVFGQQGNIIQRGAGTAAADSVNRTNQSMASRGISGGSVMDDANAKSSNDIYANMFKALEQLGLGRAGAETGIMDNANRMDFMGKNAELGATKDRYGVVGGALQGQTQNMQGFDNTNAWDDIMNVAQLGAQVGSALILAPEAAAAAPVIAAASDISVKENINHEGVSELGFPIITFNYIWDKTKRYIGTIAQEVEKILPEAVIEEDGIKKVYYDLIDVQFYEV